MRSAKKTSLLAALLVAGFQQVSQGQVSQGQDTFGSAQVSRAAGSGAPSSQVSSLVPVLPAPHPHSKPSETRVRPTSPEPSPGCFFLNARSFTIPFTVDAAGAQPREVQLFTSRGPSSPWQKIDGKPAADKVKEFQFTGSEDGEFWFATRTIDAGGRAHPSGPIQPQLKVFVDTSRPQVVLNADADASGRVEAAVSISDATQLTLQLRYVTDAEAAWQNVDAQPLQQGGKLNFTPQKSWEQLSLQLIATDASKNQSVVSKLINRPRLADSGSSRFASTRSGEAVEANSAQYRVDSSDVQTQTVADSVPSNGYAANGYAAGVPLSLGGYRGAALPPHLARPTPPRATPYSQTRPFGPPSVYRNPATALTQNTLPPAATAEQISNGFGLNSPQQAPPVAPRDVAPIDLVPETQSPKPATEFRPRTPAEAMRPLTPIRPDKQAESKVESLPTPEAEVDPDSNRHAARKSIDVETAAGRAPIRYSDSMRFSLDFELEAIGNAGVEAIELYGSTDSGKTWKFWGRDPDRISPFDIETKEQGVFGFRIVVLGRNGLTSPRPLPGESPDIVVVVDKEKPVVRISGAQYGEGDRVGSLVIQYECEDANLRQRPVALSFSNTVDGPWTTIAAGLRNDGNYVWPADPGLPRQMYLRIDATDQAGNVGTYILDRPIDAQGLAPRARIRGFQSLSGGEVAAPGQQTANRPRATFK